MKTLIIEDEALAAEQMELLLRRYNPNIEILAKCDSIKKSVKWFDANLHPDLIFMDIQLADGLSFEIFEQTEIKCPVIFTTAYDAYALRAFKVNSVDYLLKPIDFEELTKAIDKFNNLLNENKVSLKPIQNDVFDKIYKMLSNEYKSKFLVKIGVHLRSVNTEEINYFYSLEKGTFICTNDAKNYAIDYSLDQIENLINPSVFFRINRKYLISSKSIEDIVVFSNSRLKIKLKNCKDDTVTVSREKVQNFRKWLED
jgi:DNA-binding LytR/AlgR family response regulator